MLEIPYGRQNIDEQDIDEVVTVLKSDFLTQGTAVPRFESDLCLYTGARYAVCVNSATSALHIACLALGVGPGDIVWTSAITFVASANCAKFCGADVDFVDIDPDFYNMSLDHLEEKLRQAKTLGKLPKVLIPVHLTGQPCDMIRINELSRQYGFKVIEDASHAIGGKYNGEQIGNCKYSDITIFSFHPVKIITTGEGGAALTNNKELAARMQSLRSHGITRDSSSMKNPTNEGWYYEQQELGFNYRLTDIQAALGSSQLKRITKFIEQRRAIASTYNIDLNKKHIKLPRQAKYSDSAWHLYVIRVGSEHRKRIFEDLRGLGIQVNVHYLPVYRHPYYSEFGYDATEFPNSEKYSSEAISIPIYPNLSGSNLNYVINSINELVGQARERNLFG